MKFDTSQAPKEGGGKSLPPEGKHALECVDAIERSSAKTGDPYMNLKLKMDGYNWHVYDVLMFGGKGAGMGKKKAEAFGIDTDADVQPEDFIGRRAIGYLVYESYQGQRKLAVDPSQGACCGYDMEDGF